MHKHFVAFLSFILFAGIAQANIIRDSEIEETIEQITAPIARVANLKNIKIYIIQDDTPNAFTDGGERLYICSGMITQFPNIDVLRAVIAHEIGHILGKHVARRQGNIDTYNKVAIASATIGLLAAAASDASLEAAAAIALGGAHIADRSIMAYSRVYEASADQAAMTLLEKSECSVQGMMEFFEYVNKRNRGVFINPYDQTHPLSQDRIIAIKNHYQKSKFKISTKSPELEYKFERTAAELIAFTAKEPKKLLNNKGLFKSDEINNYIKAICYFRIGDLYNSIENVNKLIALRPSDPFYHELKGQILFEFGKKESLDSYNIAYKLKPNDLLIKLSRAIVGITMYSKQVSALQTFYPDLKSVSDLEPDNIIALYYLTLYYDRVHDKPRSLLYSAVIALKTGNITRAKALARQAIKGFSKDTPDWYKANDIIN